MVLNITGLRSHKEGLLPVQKPFQSTLRSESGSTVDTVFAESGPRLSVAAYRVHAPLPVLVTGVPQPMVTGRDEPYRSGCDTGNLPSGGCGAGDIHGYPHMGSRPAEASAYSPVDHSGRRNVSTHLEKR